MLPQLGHASARSGVQRKGALLHCDQQPPTRRYPIRIRALTLLVTLITPASALASPATQTYFRIMDGLAIQNVDASAAIRSLYSEYLHLLVLDGYADMESALGTGGLVPLPPDPARFNIVLRTGGEHPIGEKDLGNQASYLAARPATMGCLLDVAARVTFGPIEVTSLVRHAEYQEVLRGTNANAITTVPMHTMGLAFDIALVNSSVKTVRDTLRVLEQMRDAGDILFIGERQQLVFHVVPHPSRLGYYSAVYARAMSLPVTVPGAHALDVPSFEPPATAPSAHVSAEVIDVRPTNEFADEWWAAFDPDGLDASVSAAVPTVSPGGPRPDRSRGALLMLGGSGLLAGLFALGGLAVLSVRGR
jgi:hypothetical protein